MSSKPPKPISTNGDHHQIDELLHTLLSHLPGYDPSSFDDIVEPTPPISCFSQLSPEEQLDSFYMELLLPDAVVRYLNDFEPDEKLSKLEHHALELAIMKHHGIFDCTGFAVCLLHSPSGFRAIVQPDDGSDDIEIGDALVVPPEPWQQR